MYSKKNILTFVYIIGEVTLPGYVEKEKDP